MQQTRLQVARRLVDALEAGDARQERAASDAWVRLQEHAAEPEIARITRQLREALSSLRISEQVSGLVRSELPDAQMQLNQVLELTERAAHDTLAAVEASLPRARSITDAVNDFRMGSADALARDERLVSLLTCIDAEATQLRSHLSEVLMAQGFQDISGQILRRVAELVGELESHLGGGGFAASGVRQIRHTDRTASHGQGPARPDAGAAHVVSGQQDVDDLLSGLGI